MRKFGGILVCLIGALLALTGGGCLVAWIGEAIRNSKVTDWQSALVFGGISVVVLGMGVSMLRTGIGMMRDETGSGGGQ